MEFWSDFVELNLVTYLRENEKQKSINVNHFNVLKQVVSRCKKVNTGKLQLTHKSFYLYEIKLFHNKL